jgi:pyruvate kinase
VKSTKLICTIGPATAGRIPALVEAGMDVARINLAHGTAGSHASSARAVQAAATAAGRPIAVLVDLAGPKLRLGALTGGSVTLEAGQPFLLRAEGEGSGSGDRSGASVSYARLASDVRVGDRVLLADGAAELRVSAIGDDAVQTEVVRGGLVRSRAGVAIPAERLSAPALTDIDRADIPRAVAMSATYLGQSFVRGPEDVAALRGMLGPDGPAIVAKIETRPAVESFDAILEHADAVMIARGDLGVEMPYEDVPLIQKQLVRRALDRGVPAIVATQMLESMTVTPRPTRAEASDVANAVFDGADAIMLSGETAIGAYPLEAAQAAVRIVTRCEDAGTSYLAPGRSIPPDTESGALAQAAVTIADGQPGIAAIACYTRTGRTAELLASLRPGVPIVTFTPDTRVADRLALVHGVVPRTSVALDEADRLGAVHRLLAGARLVAAGSTVVLVSSSATPGSAPDLLAVQRIDG